MREDKSAAVSEEGIVEGDGGVEVLADVKIAVVECSCDDLKENFIWLWDRLGHFFQVQVVIAPRTA